MRRGDSWDRALDADTRRRAGQLLATQTERGNPTAVAVAAEFARVGLAVPLTRRAVPTPEVVFRPWAWLLVTLTFAGVASVLLVAWVTR